MTQPTQHTVLPFSERIDCDECLTQQNVGETYYTDVYYPEYDDVFYNCQYCYDYWLINIKPTITNPNYL